MTHSKGILAAALLLSLAGYLHAEEERLGEQAAQSYSYAGCYVGMPFAQFKTFPRDRITFVSSEKGMDESCYGYQLSDDSSMLIKFYQSAAYNVILVLDKEKVNEMGGAALIQQKLLETFGQPDFARDYALRWNYDRIGRQVTYHTTESFVMISVTDPRVIQQIEQAKVDRIELGF